MSYPKVKTAVYDKDGDFMFAFESMTEAAKVMKVEVSYIGKCFKYGIRLHGNYYIEIKNGNEIPDMIPIKKYRRGGKGVVIYTRPRTIYKIACSLKEASDMVGASITSIRTHIHKKEWHERTNLFYEFADPEDLFRNTHPLEEKTIPKTRRNHCTAVTAYKEGFKKDFKSISDCARDLKINRIGIIHVLKGRQPRAGGYHIHEL